MQNYEDNPLRNNIGIGDRMKNDDVTNDELFNREVGEYIQSLRKKQGMTLERLAEQANISIDYLKRIEMGEGDIYFFDVMCIARSLDIYSFANDVKKIAEKYFS
ncbi:helix-turn-helix domain-containing protein [Aquibacillus sediminis]|uniref:helix-turn-helix domain-containing protein n=1 Tax=Aquibacillus sediminis TaxID=2574734 RepID=UPI001487279E|nr:helix-turn-helix transcriptional regulator [Aquibacillus sediminis]